MSVTNYINCSQVNEKHKAYDVYVTNNYSMFKRLDGNRALSDKRVGKIISSISKVGYIHNPIIVNEYFEIIDGQGRLEALKQLNIPVEYIIADNTGINECIAMNINMENWKMHDYINSYAENGNINYIRLKQLLDKYPTMPLRIIWCALYRVYKDDNNSIKNEMLSLTEQEYNKAIDRLNYIKDVWDILPDKGDKSLKGSKTIICQSMIMYYDFKEVDLIRLKNKVKTYYTRMQPFFRNEDCDIQLQELYNYKVKVEEKQNIANLIADEKLLQKQIKNEIKKEVK